MYIILSSIFEKLLKTDISLFFVKSLFFPELKIGVTLANFSFPGKTLSFIESPKILIGDFLIWLYIWFITLTSILSKPGALCIFNDLNAFKNSFSVQVFSCSFAFVFADLNFKVCITFQNFRCNIWHNLKKNC